MSDLHETKMKMLATLQHFKGKTVEEIKAEVDWLKLYSEYGIQMTLDLLEKDELVRCKFNDKKNDFIYFSTAKGKKKQEEYFD